MIQRELHLSILILEDNASDVELIMRELRKAGISVRKTDADSAEGFLDALDGKPDVILADYNLPAFGAPAALRLLAERECSIPLIVITGTLSDEAARECMDLGAADYLLKDRLARLGPAVVRAHLEGKLREEKEAALSGYRRMAAVVEATPDLVGMIDSKGAVVYLNRAGRAMTGFSSEEELPSLAIEKMVPAHALPKFEKAVAIATEVGSWLGESMIYGPNAVEIPVSQVIIAHPEEGGMFFSTVARDISRRIEGESRLRESRSRFQAVWRYSNEAMRLTNREGVIQDVNDAYCRLVGMAKSELVGQCFTVAYPEGEDRKALKELMRRRYDEGVPVSRGERRVKFLHRDREIDVELFLDRIVVEGGEKLLLTRVRDISERKELETRFLRSQRMECIGALAGGIAHDFNNILAPIFMASSMLRMEMSPRDRERALSTIEESGQRGADVVRRLLLFARGIEGEKKPLEPAELFRELVAIVEQSFPRSIRLDAKVQPDLATVHGDRTQLYQVFLNICLNARDAMPKGGTLTLGARNVVLETDNLPESPYARTGTYIVVRVGDTGIGIPKEQLEQIFEPFFSTKAEDAGTGLGLSTSLGIIKSHGGFITVESAPGEGARFDIYLPVSVADDANLVVRGDAEGKTRFGGEGEAGGSGELILVVDDERLVLEVMSKVLRKCGYRTLLATSGAEGLERLLECEEPIAAIVTDLIMPEMDGLQFLRKVRETHPRMPAIAMSGNVDQSFLSDLAKVGVTEIIDKPFRAEHLLKIIRGVLE